MITVIKLFVVTGVDSDPKVFALLGEFTFYLVPRTHNGNPPWITSPPSAQVRARKKRFLLPAKEAQKTKNNLFFTFIEHEDTSTILAPHAPF
jgi:hypothetical protein